MLHALNDAISITSLIWLFLAAFMLHDFEEIIRIEPWFRKHADDVLTRIPAALHKDFINLSRMTSSQFAVAVCLEFILFIPVTYLAAERGFYLPFIGFNVMLFIHVFMHVGQAIYVRRVVPGVVTAVLITLPYSLYLFYRLLDANLIDPMDLVYGAPFGLLLVPIVLAGHRLGELLVPYPTSDES
jgi:hypothetical protein